MNVAALIACAGIIGIVVGLFYKMIVSIKQDGAFDDDLPDKPLDESYLDENDNFDV